MKYFKLFLLLSLVLCIQLTLADKTKRNKCPKNMALVRCSTEFQGVCAFFKQNKHDRHLSQKYSANGCIACTDSRVKYTEEGACNGKKVFCDANIRPEFCTKEYFPVCGYNSKCKGDDCGIPAGNKCMACANSEIEWYVQGECPEKSNVVTCDPKNRPEICPAIYQPVCATIKTCKGKVCTTTTRTAGSGCTACGDASVISYVPGECPPVVTQCNPKNRPDFCEDIYDPVCATLQVCTGSVCTRTAGNACSACSDPNVISHIPGECPIVATQCDPKNRPQFCTDIYDPVCATIEECSRRGCTQRTQTIANGCDACATKNVVSHVPGECSM